MNRMLNSSIKTQNIHGVVVEISYMQNRKDLAKLAWDYITYSYGDIKMVIGLDLQYDTKEATVAVWRPRAR